MGIHLALVTNIFLSCASSTFCVLTGHVVKTELMSALMLLCLDYCNTVLVAHPASILAPLVLHMTTAQMMFSLKPHDPLWELPITVMADYKLRLQTTNSVFWLMCWHKSST